MVIARAPIEHYRVMLDADGGTSTAEKISTIPHHRHRVTSEKSPSTTILGGVYEACDIIFTSFLRRTLPIIRIDQQENS